LKFQQPLRETEAAVPLWRSGSSEESRHLKISKKSAALRHEDIDGAGQAFARGGVQEQFAEVEMKPVIHPAGGATFKRDGPLDNGETAIELGVEPGKMMPLRLRRERRGLHGASVTIFGKKLPANP
jgi:hypothetical protein